MAWQRESAVRIIKEYCHSEYSSFHCQSPEMLFVILCSAEANCNLSMPWKWRPISIMWITMCFYSDSLQIDVYAADKMVRFLAIYWRCVANGPRLEILTLINRSLYTTSKSFWIFIIELILKKYGISSTYAITTLFNVFTHLQIHLNPSSGSLSFADIISLLRGILLYQRPLWSW